MDASYFLLLATGEIGEEALELHPFDSYSELWQYLQDRLFLDRIKWYQIFWGDTLIMQRVLI
jgi:hypothetical protein